MPHREEGESGLVMEYAVDSVEPHTCILRLTGDIDLAAVPDVRRQLDAALDEGATNIVFDLQHVEYADSSALGLLVWLDHRLRPLGGRVVLAGANRDISRILEISGLAYVAASFGMTANVSAALEGLGLPEEPVGPFWTKRIESVSSADVLGDVRGRVTEALRPLDFPEAALFDVKVAVGEALSNAVRHGQPKDGDAGVLRVDIHAYEDRVTIDVMDNGAGFDGRGGEPDDVYATSGRGLMFMRALVDRVEFMRSPMGGTMVRLTKHRLSES